MDGNIVISISAVSFSLCVAMMGLNASLTKVLMTPIRRRGRYRLDNVTLRQVLNANSFGRQFIGVFSPKALSFLATIFVYSTFVRVFCELPLSIPYISLGIDLPPVNWEEWNVIFMNSTEALLIGGWLCFMGLLVVLDYFFVRGAVMSRRIRTIETG